jgi:hypothetical protein
MLALVNVQILEGKEERWRELLGDMLPTLGLTLAPERYNVPPPGDAQSEAAAEKLLGGHDATVWIPQKRMMVSESASHAGTHSSCIRMDICHHC